MDNGYNTGKATALHWVGQVDPSCRESAIRYAIDLTYNNMRESCGIDPVGRNNRAYYLGMLRGLRENTTKQKEGLVMDNVRLLINVKELGEVIKEYCEENNIDQLDLNLEWNETERFFFDGDTGNEIWRPYPNFY